MNTEGLIAAAGDLVKELQGRINDDGMDLQEAEAKILEMVNWIGDEMVQEVVAGLAEPTSANQITVGGEVAVFERVRNLRFINRFGEEVVHPRRCYRDRSGGVAPLDVKLGIDGCFGYSPLMTYLICMLGADESYAGAATKLEAMLGFKVSSTAVQRTTEKTGERIPEFGIGAQPQARIPTGNPCGTLRWFLCSFDCASLNRPGGSGTETTTATPQPRGSSRSRTASPSNVQAVHGNRQSQAGPKGRDGAPPPCTGVLPC